MMSQYVMLMFYIVSCLILFRVTAVMLASNSVSTIFRCISCSFGTRDQSTYAEHIKHCSNESASETLPFASDGEEVQNNSLNTVKINGNSRVCTECHLSTSSSRELLLHQRDVHGKAIRIFVCKFCSSCASQHVNTIFTHARTKHSDRALKNALPYIELHKESVIEKSSANNEANVDESCISAVQTEPCKEEERSIPDIVISSKSLGLHLLGRQFRDNGQDEFVCVLCSYSHVVSHIIVKHIWKYHKDTVSEVTAEATTTQATESASMTNIIYKCDDCSYSTREKKSFYNHCSHHQFSGPSKCPHCSFCALTDGAVNMHIHKYHPNQHPKHSCSRPKSYHAKISTPCKVTKTSGNSPCKKLYAQQKQKEKWFECPHCPFKSKWPLSVYNHKVCDHLELRKRCRIMPATNNSIPSKKKVYECDICSAKFKRLSNLHSHKLKHLDIRPYQCSLCGLRSNYLRNTQTHIHNVHKGKNAKAITLSLENAKQTIEAYRKQFFSDKLKKNGTDNAVEMNSSCNKIGQQNPPDVHVFSDAGSKSLKQNVYKYNMCSANLRSVKLLKTHKNMFHSSFGRYKCSLCGFRSNYRKNTTRHIYRVHRDENATATELSLEDAKPNNDTLANSSESSLMQGTGKQPRLDNAETSHSYLGTDTPGLKKCSVCKFQTYHMSSFYRHMHNVHYGKHARVLTVKGKMSVHQSKAAVCILGTKTARSQQVKAETSGDSSTLHNQYSETKFQQSVDSREHDDSIGAECAMQKTVKSEKYDMPGNEGNMQPKTEANSSAPVQPSPRKRFRLKSFACDICPYRSSALRDVTAHRRLHEKRSGYSFACNVCPYFTLRAFNLKVHKKLHARQSNNVEKKVKVKPDGNDVIETAYEKAKVIASDLSAYDNANELDEKNIVTADKGKLDEIGQNMSVDDDDDDDEGTVNAEQVADITEENIDVSAHSRSSTINHKLPSWCCERCPYVSNRLACFKRHVWLHGKHYPYECRYCDYSVESYWQLVSHVLWHFAPNKHLVYAQPVSNLESFSSQLPNRDSVPDSVTSIDRFIPSFENSDIFLLSDATNFQCHYCPFVTEQRSEFFSHMLCHCERNAASYSCPFCSFHTDLQERLSRHVFLHFNLPGCRQNSLPPHTCHSNDWKQLDAAIEALTEKNSHHTEPHYVQTHDCGNLGYGLVESASSLNADSLTTEKQAVTPSDCDDDLFVKKPVSMLRSGHSDNNDVSSVPAVFNMHTDESVSSDKQHANVTHSTVLADVSLVEQTSSAKNENVTSATLNKTKFCRYCDRLIDDPAALYQHEACHLVGCYQQLPSVGRYNFVIKFINLK